MKKQIFSYIFLALFLMLANYSYGQGPGGSPHKIVCSYDAAGNRIERKDVLIVIPVGGGGSSEKWGGIEDTSNKKPELFEANIYPNPVAAELNISVNAAPENANITMSIYDLSGRRIRAVNNAKTNETINLEGVANGMYVVEVIMNDKKRSWNILKQQ